MIAYADVININKQAFIRKLIEVSAYLKTDPSWLMIVLKIESGFNRKIVNKHSGAVGLLQWIPKFVAPLLGVPEYRVKTVIQNMSGVEQLDLVAKFLAPYRGKMTGPYQTYLAVFWPAALGKPESYVIGDINGIGLKRKSYAWNRYIDEKFGNNDGRITLLDIRGIVDEFTPDGFKPQRTQLRNDTDICDCCKRPF